ncbi:MAG: threonylcarbamoyl-AMP synthase, partial [Chlorobia bacterium]|nr:threonylcarbamoyl-AMP synthase [Fimbriimonadaceae bacterium]
FTAKGRPSDNPLIVHIAARNDVYELVSHVPDFAEALMDKFWPGPLTLVLAKNPAVPNVTTASLDTVAVRMPAHGIALRVIQAAQVPLAAPSANRFMALSPTRPEHIDPQLANHVEILMDGGTCDVGLESTVLDCTGAEPRILRPGTVSRADIEAILGMPVADSLEPDVKRSPGMYRRHYAPQTPAILVSELGEKDAGLTFRVPQNLNQIQMSADPRRYGAELYDALHRLDSLGSGRIVIQAPPNTPEWEAVWDRLRKATHT